MDTQTAAVGALPLAHYRFRFRALEDLRLPPYTGSAWRGALGHFLKRSVCVTQQRHCPDCLLYRSCAYPYVFETPPPPDSERMRRYSAAPHPFILRPPAHSGPLPEGETTDLGLVLVGRGDDYLPFITHALICAVDAGLGRRRERLELESVARETRPGSADWVIVHTPGGPMERVPTQPLTLPPLPQRPIDLVFETPLRLRRQNDHITPDRFIFGDLFSGLLRRVSMLSYFHCGQDLDLDFAGLTRAGRQVPLLDKALTWHDWSRWSSRQKELLQMGGLVGRISLAPEHLGPFWPFLVLGQWVHAGKGTAMGLGRYRIEGAASLPQTPAG